MTIHTRVLRRARVALLALIAAGSAPMFAQDLAAVAVGAPATSCGLSNAEPIRVTLFNFGPNLPAGSSFNVSYTVGAGAPVVELVVLASTLLTNSTLIYTFTTTADLSAPGTYALQGAVLLAGDTNPTNNVTPTVSVTNVASSIGGTVSGPASGASGTLNLSGQRGSVVQWEESPDQLRWFRLVNTSTSQSFSALSAPTHFRVRVVNAPCPAALSNVVQVLP